MKIVRSWRVGPVVMFGVVLVASACQRPGPPPPLLDTGDMSTDAPEADTDGARDADVAEGDLADTSPDDLADAPPDDLEDLPPEDVDATPDDLADAPPDDMDPDALPPGQCRTAADCDTAISEACFAGRCGNIYRVSVGEYHACALREDRTLACWGSTEFGAAEAPAGLFLDVSAGNHHTCAIRDSNNGNDTGDLICWGANVYGEATRPAGFFRQVSAGETHTCALNQDNRARCWGEEGNPASSRYADDNAFLMQISAGTRHNCALEVSGDAGLIRCWGDNTNGQLDVVADDYQWVTAGRAHSCGVRAADGRVVCWGDDTEGQLAGVPTQGGWTGVEARGDYTCAWAQGDDERDAVCWGGHATPPAPEAVGQLSVGANNGCGVYSDGALRCWGDNHYGQASPPYGRVRQVAAGIVHTCVLDYDDQVRCWGGESGAEPVEGLDQYRFAQITANDNYTCGLSRGNGEAHCWSHGGLIDRFALGMQFTHLSAGRFHACGVLADNGEVVCVGEDGDPNLDVPEGLRASFVDAGELWTCALDAEGAPRCWGLGALTPPDGLTLSTLSVGLAHVCGVSAVDGEVVCWGENEAGQASPPAVVGMRAISAAPEHSCGLTQQGEVLCWGRRDPGSLGYVTPPNGEYTAIDTISLKTCALRVDGRAVCQGYLGVLY